MLRYYIAVEPPEGQRRRIATVMSRLGDPWPVPHVTLISPLALSPDLTWLRGVHEVAAKWSWLRLRFGRPATFDERVLYLSVEGEGLGALHLALLEAVYSSAGTRSVERPFVAHLTLSVAHGSEPLGNFTQLTESLSNFDAFEASRLTIFQRDHPRAHYRAWDYLPLCG